MINPYFLIFTLAAVLFFSIFKLENRIDNIAEQQHSMYRMEVSEETKLAETMAAVGELKTEDLYIKSVFTGDK